eukprot:Filipodium_phascolosomae@DN2761_c0_g1_i5.p1
MKPEKATQLLQFGFKITEQPQTANESLLLTLPPGFTFASNSDCMGTLTVPIAGTEESLPLTSCTAAGQVATFLVDGNPNSATAPYVFATEVNVPLLTPTDPQFEIKYSNSPTKRLENYTLQ